jgi:hypothetical protein
MFMNLELVFAERLDGSWLYRLTTNRTVLGIGWLECYLGEPLAWIREHDMTPVDSPELTRALDNAYLAARVEGMLSYHPVRVQCHGGYSDACRSFSETIRPAAAKTGRVVRQIDA